jgi:hypothetical protein
MKFVAKLLDVGVAVTPGVDSRYGDYARITFTQPRTQLKLGGASLAPAILAIFLFEIKHEK